LHVTSVTGHPAITEGLPRLPLERLTRDLSYTTILTDWFGAQYRNPNFIEYADGKDITNINRDDASGFQLDTLTTHGKHGTPAVIGQGYIDNTYRLCEQISIPSANYILQLHR